MTEVPGINKVKGVVVFLDILGTKNKWREDQAIPFLQKLEKIANDFELLRNIEPDLVKANEYEYGSTKVNLPKDTKPPKMNVIVSNFSDTFIVALYGDMLPNAFLIYWSGYSLIPIFRKAFKQEVFLRGTLSIGEFYVSDKLKDNNKIILVGPAINDAAQGYENDNWIGLTTSPSATLTLEQDHKIFADMESETFAIIKDKKVDMKKIFEIMASTFVQYDIPKKNGNNLKGWALAWPKYYSKDDRYHDQESLEKIINYNLSYTSYQERFVDDEVFLKFRNTKEFFSFASREAHEIGDLLTMLNSSQVE